MSVIVSHVKLFVPLLVETPERVMNAWAEGLKVEAEAINQKRKAVIPDEVSFQKVLATPSNLAYARLIDPGFISRAGLKKEHIVARHAANLRRSFAKYDQRLAEAFATREGIPAKRFKDAVQERKAHFAEGIAERTLPFTGIRVEGRSVAAIASYWLTRDVTTEGMLRAQDEVLQGGPFLITKPRKRAALKAALTERLTQAGVNILRMGFLENTIRTENDEINGLLQGFVDPALGLKPFATAGESHLDYTWDGNQLWLDLQVSTV